ncbi:MAG: hypothetical protein U0587_02425 [Candidatus Binatia bacterium]
MLAQPTPHIRASESSPRIARLELGGLGNRFLGLLGRRWSRRSFATEVAKLLAETAQAKAVAVLAYERHRDRLVLLADCGLSSDARLTLGGAVDTAWEIPVRGLKGRRISVVEAAHQNPLVPESLRCLGAEGLCVVSLPVYYDAAPVGAVVLFAARSRAFTDAQLQVLSQALRVCGRGLREREPAPAHVLEPTHADAWSEAAQPAVGLPDPGAMGGATTLTGTSHLQVGDGTPTSVVDRGIADARSPAVPSMELDPGRTPPDAQRSNEALRNLLHASRAVRAERDRLRQQVAEIEALRARDTTELRGQLATLEDRLLAVESERQRTQRLADAQRRAADEALQALRGERDTLRERLDALESSAAETGGQLSALDAAREALAVQLRAAQAEQDQLRARYAQASEAFAEERERWQSQEALEAAQRQRLADEIAALHAQLEPFRVIAAERDALAQSVADLRGAGADLEGTVAGLQQQVTAARAEGDALREQLHQRDATLETMTGDCERLQRAQLAADAEAAAAAAEIRELRDAVREAGRRLDQERRERAAELDALLQEVAPEGALDVGAEPPGERPPSQPSDAAPVDDVLTIERSAPLASLADVVPEAIESLPPAVAPSPAGSLGELVVLDDEVLANQACAALAAAGFEVSALPLAEATVDELARRKLKCVMLNLGAGGPAWRTLRLLRERTATRNVPVLAYAMNGQCPTGFCLGRVDFALWPLESGRLIERLGRLRPKLQRLLMVSADVEGMGALRVPLGRAKISTSIVLDAKQALEFASMVEPDAAVVHLAPTCPSAASAIAGLRANESTRDLPILVLLDEASITNEEDFFVAAGGHWLRRAGFQFLRLPEEIGRLIG